MDALWLWLALALLVFWMLGAHNRLVRLRGQVRLAFQAVDQYYSQYLRLVDTHMPHMANQSLTAAQAGLRGAVVQFDNSLRRPALRAGRPATNCQTARPHHADRPGRTSVIRWPCTACGCRPGAGTGCSTGPPPGMQAALARADAPAGCARRASRTPAGPGPARARERPSS